MGIVDTSQKLATDQTHNREFYNLKKEIVRPSDHKVRQFRQSC